jgi:ABC-type lipoprotein release transport system permease subunit
MGQLFLIAFRNLVQHQRRTFLLGGAIAAVTALLVILLGLSNGIQETLVRSATTLVSGHVNVGGFYKVSAGQAAPVVVRWPELEALIRREVPELTFLSERGRGWAKLISDTGGSVQAGVAGVNIAREPGLKDALQLVQGRIDDLAEPHTLLLFEDQAKKLDAKVGDTLTLSAITMRGVTNTLDVRVVAICKSMGLLSGFNVFVQGDSLRQLYQLKPDATGALLIYLKDMRAVPQVQERLRTLLAKQGFSLLEPDPRAFWFKFEAVTREPWTGQKLDVTTWEDEISFMKWSVKALRWLSGLLIFVLLVIISVGIMNTLWIAIRERTREIGTLRAVGMQRLRVLGMFVAEGFLLGLISTTAGALLGWIATGVLNLARVPVPVSVQLFVNSDTLHFSAEWGMVLFSVALITACTSAISLIPSFLAARMKPVTAMHHVG